MSSGNKRQGRRPWPGPPSAVQNIAAVGRPIEVFAETQQSLRERVRSRGQFRLPVNLVWERMLLLVKYFLPVNLPKS